MFGFRYSPEQLYNVVAAVDLYHDFLPWCQRSDILRQYPDGSFDAELEIGFKFFVESYVSHVELLKLKRIKVDIFLFKLNMNASTNFLFLDPLFVLVSSILTVNVFLFSGCKFIFMIRISELLFCTWLLMCLCCHSGRHMPIITL